MPSTNQIQREIILRYGKKRIEEVIKMNKYQDALNNIKIMGDKDLYNERHIEWANTLQELINEHKKIKEDLLFLKEQGIEMLESPNGRKFLALEITNMPSEINYRKEIFEKLMNDIIKNIINGE